MQQDVWQHGLQQQQLLWHRRLSRPGFLQQQQGVQQQGVQQVMQQQLGWQQLGWQHGVGQGAGQHGAGQGAGHGAGQGWHTGTMRQRLTHTSTGTQVLTCLQIVQGTHWVTVYGTQVFTVYGTCVQTV